MPSNNTHKNRCRHRKEFPDHAFVESERLGNRFDHRSGLFLTTHNTVEDSATLFRKLFFLATAEQVSQFVKDSVVLLFNHVKNVIGTLSRVCFFHQPAKDRTGSVFEKPSSLFFFDT